MTGYDLLTALRKLIASSKRSLPDSKQVGEANIRMLEATIPRALIFTVCLSAATTRTVLAETLQRVTTAPAIVVGIDPLGKMSWNETIVADYQTLAVMLAATSRKHPHSDIWIDASKSLDGSQAIRVSDMIEHYHLRVRYAELGGWAGNHEMPYP